MKDEFKEARKKKEHERHKNLVLEIFDKFERADKRAFVNRKKQIERENRKKW